MSRILCIIPARGGSKGLPGKNIKTLIDKPLIAWTIDAAKKSRYIDKVIVSTDDSKIKTVSIQYEVDVIDRPYELATDDASTIDVILHSLEILRKEHNYLPEYVMLLQCTSPLRNEKHIDEAIEKLINNQSGAKSLISVTKEEHPPFWLRKINSKGYLERYFNFDANNLARRQDFEELYRPNGAIYLAKTNQLIKNRSYQTEKTMPYIMDAVSSIDIDTEIDFKLVEVLLNKRPSFIMLPIGETQK